MKNHSLILFLILIIMIPCFHCTIINVAGGSSSTDNGKITGFVSLDNNMPASNTLVTLRLADFDPCSDTIVPGVDTTDADGKYEFTSLQSGIYTIEAVATGGKRALVTSVMVDTSSTHVAAVSLAQPGRIEVLIPECAAESNCYVYIPGTSCFGEISNGIAYLDSVPAGYIPALYYVNQKNRSNHSVKNGISLAEGETKVIADYSAWKYSRKIGLNTTRDGADIAGNIYQFPVLIRLANDNFDFERALPDGSDIRFKKADDTPIPFEIERWDRENKRAEIWVIIDTVYGYNEGQYFLMYWGNSSADAVTSGNPVFDTARGFQGVWHLAEPGGTTTFDATCNGYNGTPFGMLSLSSVSGVIGKAIDFDGKGSYIVMRNTAESKINFPEDQRYSISLWAYADTIDTVWHSIASKGHRQYYLQYKCFHDTAASWEFVEYQNGGGWDYSEYKVSPAPGIKQWVYLTGVRDGVRQCLYVNGVMVRDSALLNPNSDGRGGNDFTLGCHVRLDLLPQIKGYSFFDGKIDEVRIMNTVPGADWVRLCYMNQKNEDMLVEFR